MSPHEPPPALTESALTFLGRRALATLTTLRSDGTPHVVPVGFTYDVAAGLARVITSGSSVKVANARRRPQVALCQVDGADWLTLEGLAEVHRDEARVGEAVHRYAQRYRTPRPNPERVVIEITVLRVLASRSLTSPG